MVELLQNIIIFMPPTLNKLEGHILHLDCSSVRPFVMLSIRL